MLQLVLAVDAHTVRDAINRFRKIHGDLPRTKDAGTGDLPPYGVILKTLGATSWPDAMLAIGDTDPTVDRKQVLDSLRRFAHTYGGLPGEAVPLERVGLPSRYVIMDRLGLRSWFGAMREAARAMGRPLPLERDLVSPKHMPPTSTPRAMDRETVIVYLYCDLEMGPKEIGGRFGLTSERIRQILRAHNVAPVRGRNHRGPRVAWRCEGCERTENRLPSQARRKFCSDSCRAASRTRRLIENPPAPALDGHRYAYDNRTQSRIRYARFLVQEREGRALGADEVVLFKDGDEDNFCAENLVILSRSQAIMKTSGAVPERSTIMEMFRGFHAVHGYLPPCSLWGSGLPPAPPLLRPLLVMQGLGVWTWDQALAEIAAALGVTPPEPAQEDDDKPWTREKIVRQLARFYRRKGRFPKYSELGGNDLPSALIVLYTMGVRAPAFAYEMAAEAIGLDCRVELIRGRPSLFINGKRPIHKRTRASRRPAVRKRAETIGKAEAVVRAYTEDGLPIYAVSAAVGLPEKQVRQILIERDVPIRKGRQRANATATEPAQQQPQERIASTTQPPRTAIADETPALISAEHVRSGGNERRVWYSVRHLVRRAFRPTG